jgi:rod shape-determining protein MreC
VGTVTAARPGNPFQQVFLTPSGLQGGLEEVLVILEGVHQPIPELPPAATPVHLQPPPPPEAQDTEAPPIPGAKPNAGTDADRLLERYRNIGEAQGHKFGEGLPGSKPPDFNLKPEDAAARTAKPAVPPAQPLGAAPLGAPPAGATGQPQPPAPVPAKPKPVPQP